MPRRIAKLNKPRPLRKDRTDDNIAVVTSKDVDTIKWKSDSSRNDSISIMSKMSSVQEVEAKGNEVNQKTITRDLETSNNVPVPKKDITSPESHCNQDSSPPSYQSQISADSGYGDDGNLPSLSRQSSNLNSVEENGDLLSFDLHDQEKEVKKGVNQDGFTESFVVKPKQIEVSEPQSFNLAYVPATAEDLNNYAKRNVLKQGQRITTDNFTQLCNAVNTAQVYKGQINSIEGWETKLNRSSKTTTPDKCSGYNTTNGRNGDQYTDADNHLQLHSPVNITKMKIIKAVHGNKNWKSELKSISQPVSCVTHSQFDKNISEIENWELDLIDVSNDCIYSKIGYCTPEKRSQDIYQKNVPRISVTEMDWENGIYDSDASAAEETSSHVQEISFNMNKNSGCSETLSECECSQFICVRDQSTPKAYSVLEKHLEALDINDLSVYQDSYVNVKSIYDAACSWSDSIHSPPQRSMSLANHSLKFENVDTCMMPSFAKNIFLPDNEEQSCELMEKTSIVECNHFHKSNSSSDRMASVPLLKDNSRRVLVHVWEPISPSSSSDVVQKAEETMAEIPFSTKWRQKMFAKCKRNTDMEVIFDNDYGILQYSIEQLVGYANSPSSLTISAEWSHLTKVFPEVCLSEKLDFDPEKFLENYNKGKAMDIFRYCREYTRDRQPNYCNTQDGGENFSTDYRNMEISVTPQYRGGFGVPKQKRFEEVTGNISSSIPLQDPF